jgi:hypothetical protein
LLGCTERTEPTILRGRGSHSEVKGFRTVKKLLLVALLGLGVFAIIWRKVQADRAELDLWTEATTSDD